MRLEVLMAAALGRKICATPRVTQKAMKFFEHIQRFGRRLIHVEWERQEQWETLRENRLVTNKNRGRYDDENNTDEEKGTSAPAASDVDKKPCNKGENFAQGGAKQEVVQDAAACRREWIVEQTKSRNCK